MLPAFPPSFHLCVYSEVQSLPGVNSQEPAGETKHYKHSDQFFSTAVGALGPLESATPKVHTKVSLVAL